jgi:plasmid replication initiation protein
MEIINNNQLTLSFDKKEHNYQPNLITESRQEFSEVEKKIVLLVINQLRKEVAINWQGQNLEFLIPVSDLTEKNHDRIKAAAENIITKKIVRSFGKNGKKIDDEEVYFEGFIPFPRVKYYKSGKNSYVRLTMLSDVVPYFVELGQHYTRYSLEIILSLKSVYSQRFYEIIMMYIGRNQRSFNYSVDKLKFMFDCPPSYTYDEIKRWALKPAQKELQDKAGIVFTFEPSKKDGKKIIELNFKIKSQAELALEAMKQEAENFHSGTPLEKREYLTRLLNNYRFTQKQQDEIMSDPQKWSVFMQIDSEIYNGIRNVENPTAYIAKSLGFNVKTKKK